MNKTLLLIGSASTCPDLVYATGFRAVDPVIYIQKGRCRILIVPALEIGRATREARGVTVWSPEKLGLAPRRKRRASDTLVRLVQHVGAQAVVVQRDFPLGAARDLEKHGVRVRVSREDLFPERAVKTGEEIQKIRESQQAAVIAMRGAMALLAGAQIDRTGVLRHQGREISSESLRTVIMKILYEQQCQCADTIVAGGRQGADPHERGHGVLRAGEPIVMDIFPQHLTHGYYGDLTRTVLKGSAAAELKRMYQAVKAAHAAALARVKAGVKAATVHRAAAAEFKRRGYDTELRRRPPSGFIHSTGHGVGLAIHEAPAISLHDQRLRAGNVVTIEPGLYYPEWGGIRIEDTVVVLSHGWRYLVPCEKRFEL